MLSEVKITIRQQSSNDLNYRYNIELEGEGISLSGEATVTEVDTKVNGLTERTYPREFRDHRDPIFYAVDAVGKYFQDTILTPPENQTERTQQQEEAERPLPDTQSGFEGGKAPKPEAERKASSDSPRYSSGPQSSRDIE